MKQTLRLMTFTAAIALATPAFAQNQPSLNSFEDDGAIIITGQVAAINDDEFTLSYNNNSEQVIVELDDWDWFDETNYLQVGDEVVVSGEVDDDLFEGREIEADSVYVQNSFSYYNRDNGQALPTYYIISYDQEGERQNNINPAAGTDNMSDNNQTTSQNRSNNDMNNNAQQSGQINITGTVQSMDADGEELTLSSGNSTITVNTDTFDNARSDLQRGDRIYVTGILEDGFFTGREIDAERIVKLSQKPSANQQMQNQQQNTQMPQG